MAVIDLGKPHFLCNLEKRTVWKRFLYFIIVYIWQLSERDQSKAPRSLFDMLYCECECIWGIHCTAVTSALARYYFRDSDWNVPLKWQTIIFSRDYGGGTDRGMILPLGNGKSLGVRITTQQHHLILSGIMSFSKFILRSEVTAIQEIF